jgi:hypothetical protein
VFPSGLPVANPGARKGVPIINAKIPLTLAILWVTILLPAPQVYALIFLIETGVLIDWLKLDFRTESLWRTRCVALSGRFIKRILLKKLKSIPST